MSLSQFLSIVTIYGLLIAGALEIIKPLALRPLFMRGITDATPPQEAARREPNYSRAALGIAALLAVLTSVVLYTADPSLNLLSDPAARPLSAALLTPGLLAGDLVAHELYNLLVRARLWLEAAAENKVAQLP